MDKHVLFYSNFCEFSKEVIRDMTKKDLRSKFVLICIDDKKHPLPDVVDRVPMIISNTRSVFIEDDIGNFLNLLRQIEQQGNINNSRQGQSGQPQNQNPAPNQHTPPTSAVVDGITPYSDEMSNTYSDNFSFIGSEDVGKVGNANTQNIEFPEHTFAMVNQDHRIHISEDETGRSGSKIDSGMLEKYMTQRDLEFSSVLKKPQMY